MLSLLGDGLLPEPLKPAAGSVLFASYTAATRDTAAKYLPAPTAAGGTSATPGVLALRQGDAAAGQAVFKQTCTACHRIGSEGTSFGPDLSQVGSKLAKEALFAKILQPNGGVAFGFEGYAFRLRSGETVAGYIESETAQQLSVRSMGGITTRHDKQQVVSREPLPGSLMPTGLAASMTEKQLIDLVAYLASRKGQAQSSPR